MRSDLLLYRPFIAVILFEFSFKIRNDRWRPRCGMAVMRLLLRSKQSKWCGNSLISKTVVSWLLVALIEVRNFKPLRCLSVLRLLKDKSTHSRYWYCLSPLSKNHGTWIAGSRLWVHIKSRNAKVVPQAVFPRLLKCCPKSSCCSLRPRVCTLGWWLFRRCRIRRQRWWGIGWCSHWWCDWRFWRAAICRSCPWGWFLSVWTHLTSNVT